MATDSKETPKTRVVTNKVRLSYVHVFDPWSNSSEDAKSYSVTMLIPKSDKATIAKIKAAQKEALEAGKAKFGGKIPANWKNTLHDGDEEGDLEQNPEQAGHYYMSVSSSEAYPPGVVDRNLNKIIDRSEMYSGCYGRVSMDAFAFNSNGSKGVSFGLRHVQKLEDGEPLGGGYSSPEDDFEALPDAEDEESLI